MTGRRQTGILKEKAREEGRTEKQKRALWLLVLFSALLLCSCADTPAKVYGDGVYRVGDQLESGFYRVSAGDSARTPVMTVSLSGAAQFSLDELNRICEGKEAVFYLSDGMDVRLSGGAVLEQTRDMSFFKSGAVFAGSARFQGQDLIDALVPRGDLRVRVVAPFDWQDSSYSVFSTARKGENDMLSIHEKLAPGEERTLLLLAGQYLDVVNCMLVYDYSAS